MTDSITSDHRPAILRTPITGGCMVLLGLLLCTPVAWSAEDFVRAWDEPVQIQLPPPTRTVLLRRDVDAATWLRDHGVQAASVLPMGRQSLLQFPMDEQRWNQQQSALCSSAQVADCGTAACQGIQLRSEFAGVQQPQNVKARIVKRSPQVSESGELADSQTSCGNPLAAPLADSAAGRALPNVELDLRGLSEARQGQGTAAAAPDRAGTSNAASSGAPDSPGMADTAAAANSAGTAGADPITDASAASADSDLFAVDRVDEMPGTGPADNSAMQTARSGPDFQISLNALFNPTPGFSKANLPQDTSQYDLVVGEGCGEVRIPLDSVAPASLPNRIVLLVSSGQAADIATSYGFTLLDSVTLTSTGDQLATFSVPGNIVTALAALALDTRVTAAQREFVYTTSATTGTYSDTYAPFSYGPMHTGARALHAATSGATQLVAVIDTGVAVDHPELRGRVQAEDFTGSGMSADAHGTAVAGIIAAAANNAQGIYGVAPQTRILNLKACQPVDEDGMAARCWSSSLVKALDAAMAKDVAIINMSLAGPPDPLVAKYVAAAVARNILIVAGAGNGGPAAKPAFPAALPDVLAVTAVDRDNRAYSQANVGDYIDLAAPGVDIVTPSVREQDYPVSSGTSWAAAHVAGVAALMRDLVPLMGAREITAMLNANSGDLGTIGRDAVFGHGLVNACRAAETATGDAVACTQSASLQPSGQGEGR